MSGILVSAMPHQAMEKDQKKDIRSLRLQPAEVENSVKETTTELSVVKHVKVNDDNDSPMCKI